MTGKTIRIFLADGEPTGVLLEVTDNPVTGKHFHDLFFKRALNEPRIRRSLDAGAKLEEQRVADTIEDAYAHEHEVRPRPAPSRRSLGDHDRRTRPSRR